MRRPGNPIPDRPTPDEMRGICEDLGGTYQYDPTDEDVDIHACDVGQAEITLHAYDPTDDHSVIVRDETRETEWTGSMRDLRYDETSLILEGASGNPGPLHGPMRVENAEVRVSEYGVDVEQRRRL